jgi:hypothetical protein
MEKGLFSNNGKIYLIMVLDIISLLDVTQESDTLSVEEK